MDIIKHKQFHYKSAKECTAAKGPKALIAMAYHEM